MTTSISTTTATLILADTNISQGSVAKRFRCGGIFNDHVIANLLLSGPVLPTPPLLGRPHGVTGGLIKCS